jgi:hypothetical protein
MAMNFSLLLPGLFGGRHHGREKRPFSSRQGNLNDMAVLQFKL